MLIGFALAGGGVALWWLTPAAVDHSERTSRARWGRLSDFERAPDATRFFSRTMHRAGAVLMVVLGLVVIVTALGYG